MVTDEQEFAAKMNNYFIVVIENLDIESFIPIHKKDEKINKENYRPVSLLPTISKIFERDMYNQINIY